MAMWSPAGFKKVLPQPELNAAGGLPVSGAWDIEILEELPAAADVAGAPAPKWLKVCAYSSDREVIQEGFMLQEWLKVAPVAIEREVFGRACLAAAQDQGTGMEFLLAFADLVSKVSNLPPKPSTACGPFQFTEDVWKDEIAASPTLGRQPFDRFDPYLQPSVAASMAARAEKANPKIPMAQLAMILLFGQRQADKLVAQPPGTAFDAALREAYKDHPQGAALADLKFNEDPAQLYKDPVTGKTRSLADVTDLIADKLDPLFDDAEDTLGPEIAKPDVTDPVILGKGDELKLGKNETYRDALLAAAERTKFAAPALAALIDAEADKKQDGSWDPVSRARTSSALGLTQFTIDTWKTEAGRKGTFLNQKARELGFLTEAGIVDEGGLLGLRLTPLISIVAAAEFALSNLAQLAKQGVTVESLTADNSPLMARNDAEGNKAKLAYLAHHEGFAGALAVVRGTLKEDRAEKLLRANQKRRADELHAQAGSWRKAYIDWLFSYIRSRIVPENFIAPAKGDGQVAKPAGGTSSPSKPVKAANPGSSAGPGGIFKLTEAHLIGLWKRSAFPIDTRGVIVFGIRGCLPVDVEGTDFASEHAIRFATVDFKTMKCTIGQWRPGEGLALFPGSTVPFGASVRKRVGIGGAGINQMGPGRYLNYLAGFHQKKEGRAGHWALVQGCDITIQRTGDDADFDLADRWEAGDIAGDNIHCAFGMGGKGQRPLSKFSSFGCQTIAGMVRKGETGSQEGPWAKFIAPFLPNKQRATDYVLFPGPELEEMMTTQCRGKTIVLRVGSQGDLVRELQRRLSTAIGTALKDDGSFGTTTFKAMIKFQTDKFGSREDSGIVDSRTAAALGFELPAFNFDDAIAGGSGQSRTAPAPQGAVSQV